MICSFQVSCSGQETYSRTRTIYKRLSDYTNLVVSTARPLAKISDVVLEI